MKSRLKHAIKIKIYKYLFKLDKLLVNLQFKTAGFSIKYDYGTFQKNLLLKLCNKLSDIQLKVKVIRLRMWSDDE